MGEKREGKLRGGRGGERGRGKKRERVENCFVERNGFSLFFDVLDA